MSRSFDLVIFDWDGTLSDSAQLIVDSMQTAIRELHWQPREDKAIRELIGLSFDDCLRRLYPDQDPVELRRLLEGFRREWLGPRGGGFNEAPLFAGALEAVNGLYEGGYTLAVATGKSRPGLNRSLKHHRELAQLLMATRTADETAAKPDPLMLKQLLAEFGLAPERALMVGDTEYDLHMAAAIGMPAVGVACGVHEVERLHAAGAAVVLDDVAALPEWLVRG